MSHENDDDARWAEILAYGGKIMISAATAAEIDRLGRRRARGLPVFVDEIEAVLYDVAVAYDEAVARDAEAVARDADDKQTAERVRLWLLSDGVIWIAEPA